MSAGGSRPNTMVGDEDTTHFQDARPHSLQRLSSHEILRGNKAMEIVHEGATYRLQATRLGKLILTK